MCTRPRSERSKEQEHFPDLRVTGAWGPQALAEHVHDGKVPPPWPGLRASLPARLWGCRLRTETGLQEVPSLRLGRSS